MKIIVLMRNLLLILRIKILYVEYINWYSAVNVKCPVFLASGGEYKSS